MAAQDHFTLRNIYLYGVCFVTLLIAIFAAVNLVRSTVELVYPDPLYYGPIYHEDEGRIDAGEQERQEQAARDSQRRSAVLGVVTSGTFLLIAGPTYAYHWRRIQHERPARRGQPEVAEGPGEGS
jgi:hypothetical protein